MGLQVVSATGCEDSGFLGNGQVNENFTMVIACPACDYINFTLTDPSNTIVLNNVQMTQNGNNFEYVVEGDTLNYTGTYFGNGGDSSSPLGFCFDVTTNGQPLSLFDVIIRIIILLLFLSLPLIMYFTTRNINFEKWYNSVLKKYETKNFVKMALSGLLYFTMNNSYILYYLMGLPVLLLLLNTVTVYNIASMILFIQVVVSIYFIGIILLGIVFLGYLQEWVVTSFDLVKDMEWGIK